MNTQPTPDWISEATRRDEAHWETIKRLSASVETKEKELSSLRSAIAVKDEALRAIAGDAQRCLDNAHWEVRFGSGDLIKSIAGAKEAISPNASDDLLRDRERLDWLNKPHRPEDMLSLVGERDIRLAIDDAMRKGAHATLRSKP